MTTWGHRSDGYRYTCNHMESSNSVWQKQHTPLRRPEWLCSGIWRLGHRRTRTPGSSLVHFTSQTRLLGRSATSACLPSLLPASSHTCHPEVAWNPSSAVALYVHSLPSPDRPDPKLCMKVPNTGVAVMAINQKVCFVRRKFRNVLFL